MKKMYQLCVMGCMMVCMFILGGCANKIDSLSEANSSIVNTTSFQLSVYDKYKLNEDESSENEKYFENDNSRTVILVYDALAENANLKANVDFYKRNLTESYGISESEIEATICPVTNHNDCYYLTWNYLQDNHNYVAVSYMIYEKGTILFLTETSFETDKKTMDAELLEMVQTVRYTGDYHLPSKEEYPFTVENSYARITVNEGFVSLQAIQAAMESEKQYVTDSNTIVVRYAAADDYNKGMISKFSVEYLEEQQNSLKMQAEEAYKHFQDLQEDGGFEAPTIEDSLDKTGNKTVDDNMDSSTVYKVSVKTNDEAAQMINRYYIEIYGNKFCISISYPLEDEAAMRDMYQLFKDVEFLTQNGAEEKNTNNGNEMSEATTADDSESVTNQPEVSTTESETTENPTENSATKITLSGKPDDIFVAEADCYTENDEIVMYFQKGITIKGDMLEIANKVMNDLCETTGLHFNKNYDSDEIYEFMDMYFAPGIFTEINSDESKINILVVNLGDAVEWASDNNAILDQSDFDYDTSFYAALYHELSHVLQFRNGVSLGSMMDEGFATYIENKTRLSHNIPAWTAAQYYFPASGGFDESLISGGEETFSYMFDDIDTNYQYGFRFITFLYETYGEDIFADILAEATKTKFSSSYDENNMEASVKANSQQLLKIIKSVTTKNALSDFSQWYDDNWAALGQEYMEEVNALGQ